MEEWIDVNASEHRARVVGTSRVWQGACACQRERLREIIETVDETPHAEIGGEG
jgi:hypothetical protein